MCCLDVLLNAFVKTRPATTELPAIQFSSMSGVDMCNLLWQADLSFPFGVLDGVYYYTDKAGWESILPLLLKDNYAAELDDCEDIAMQAMLDSSVKYSLNAMGMAVGNSPQGYHAFNILYVDGEGFKLFEPQRSGNRGGKYFDLGQEYSVDKVLI